MLLATDKFFAEATIWQGRDRWTIACPGLGTATGQMPPDEAARQMAAAYHHFTNPMPVELNWRVAAGRDGAASWRQPRAVP